MIGGNSRSRYGAVAIILHWLLAAAILFMGWLGFFMMSLEDTDPWMSRCSRSTSRSG